MKAVPFASRGLDPLSELELRERRRGAMHRNFIAKFHSY